MRDLAMTKPKVLLFSGYGINSQFELAWCFERAGASAEIKHINLIIENPEIIRNYPIIAFPGGFSFGDHLGSGKVFSNKIRFRLAEALWAAHESGAAILGICNGFQVLVKLGLLPFPNINYEPSASLVQNDKGLFENRWVQLNRNPQTKSPWLEGVDRIALPVRHGEGRLWCEDKTLEQIKTDHLDALYYSDSAGKNTMNYPDNPNGSRDGIAGLTDKSGRIFGLMPHPEAYRYRENSPNFKTAPLRVEGKAKQNLKEGDGDGLVFFYNIIKNL